MTGWKYTEAEMLERVRQKARTCEFMKTEPNANAYPQNNEAIGPEYGLTKREHFAALLRPWQSEDDEPTAEYIAEVAGLTVPKPRDGKAAPGSEWFAFRNAGEAFFRVAKADALIAALNREAE